MRNFLVGGVLVLAMGCVQGEEASTAQVAIVSPVAGDVMGMAHDESVEAGFQHSVVVSVRNASFRDVIELSASADGVVRTYRQGLDRGSSTQVTFRGITFPDGVGDGVVLSARLLRDDTALFESEERQIHIDRMPGILSWTAPAGITWCARDDEDAAPGHQGRVALASATIPDGQDVVVSVDGAPIGEGTFALGTSEVAITVTTSSALLQATAARTSGNVGVTQPLALVIDGTGPQVTAIVCDGDLDFDRLLRVHEDQDPSSADSFEMTCAVALAGTGYHDQEVILRSGDQIVGRALAYGDVVQVPVSLPAGAEHSLTAATQDDCDNASTQSAPAEAYLVDLSPPRTLTVVYEGEGAVASSAPSAAITCGETCSADWKHGTAVTLVATPAIGWVLIGWDGCDAVDGAECTVVMDGHRKVSAAFAPL